MLLTVASGIRRRSKPSIVTSAKSHSWVDCFRLSVWLRFELQMAEPECGGLCWHGQSSHVLGWGVLEDRIDDACPVEAGDDRHPPGHG